MLMVCVRTWICRRTHPCVCSVCVCARMCVCICVLKCVLLSSPPLWAPFRPRQLPPPLFFPPTFPLCIPFSQTTGWQGDIYRHHSWTFLKYRTVMSGETGNLRNFSSSQTGKGAARSSCMSGAVLLLSFSHTFRKFQARRQRLPALSVNC